MEQVVEIFPPLIGVMLDISQVPDPVFAEKMVGDGIAIDPLENHIYAPVSGTVKLVHKAKHAITITADDGFDILIHIGLETVTLNGNGFHLTVHEGDQVIAKQIIGSFDLDYIAQCAKSLISPVILSDMDQSQFFIVPQALTNLNMPIMRVMKSLIIDNLKPENNQQNSQLIKSTKIKITNPHGIHARPAAKISKLAQSFVSEVILEKNGKKANAKSVIALLSLVIEYNDIVYIYASSATEIDALTKSITSLTDAEEELTSKQIYLGQNTLEDASGAIQGTKYYGTSASDGVSFGKLILRSEMNFQAIELSTNTNAEIELFTRAIAAIKHDIEDDILHNHITESAYKNILTAHLTMLNDPQLCADVLEVIWQGKTAAFAVIQVIKGYCKILANSGNQLLIERQADFKDLCNRILTIIGGHNIKNYTITEPSILIAHELTPSDLLNLDQNIVGLVSVTGGKTSHVAILARAKRIPLLVGVSPQLLNVHNNTQVLLDSNNSYLDLQPQNDAIKQIMSQMEKTKSKRESELKSAQQPAVTGDGTLVTCLANIASMVEVAGAISNGADGVGLFRTEFIFFDREEAPTMEEQLTTYRQITDELEEKPFIIRTLDAGGEKQINYLKIPKEVNPVLGVRGIRLSFLYRDILIDQLTAILKVNSGNIKIMLPMISSLEEYREVKILINQIKHDLTLSGDIELGIMVEVPGVALMSELFAKEVDFFSIGTNDLTQYTLAVDREHSTLANLCDFFHPAVLRSIQLVVNGAKTHARVVSICGLMASEKLALPLLIGLGVNQLSMNISVIAENKALIRKLNFADCQDIANNCLNLATGKEVREYLLTKYQGLMD